ncbi:FAD-binding protein, partial [Staphylococcus aureus]|nr:FAD-binding protein [Staphylococcus aureus]
TTTGKNIAPRVAALIDVMQISDILSVEGPDSFTRPIYAGNAIATVKTSDTKLVLTVRTTAFEKAAAEGGSGTIEAVAATGDAAKSRFVGAEKAENARPELTSAKIIVSGGRALGSEEQFHALIDPLADKLGGRAVIADWRTMNAQLFEALAVERVAMFTVLSIIILVAVFNILSSLIMLVRAKTRDIAILR